MSLYGRGLGSFISMISFIILAIIFYSYGNTNFSYFMVIYALIFMGVLIASFQRYDIIINKDFYEIELISLIKRKRIEISGLKIYNVHVEIAPPGFVIITNKDKLRINYTKSNYNNIMQILELCDYKDIEFLKKRLGEKGWWINLK
jgi:hypothetical protein